MKRRDFLKLGAAATAAGAIGAPAFAQAKMVLKATDVHPLGYPTVEAVERMGKKLEAATQGRISIQMFPAMQLGGEKEMIEQAQVGALQIARISVGPMGPLVPEFNVFNLPFVFRDGAHMEKVIDGPIGDELLKKLSDHPTAGLIGLCYMNAGIRNVYNSKKPIEKVEDLKGLKIRMMGNPLFVDTMNSLGGNGVAMGFDQLINGDADRRRRRRGEQRAELRKRPALSLREVLFQDRPPDDSGAAGVLEGQLGQAVEGRSGADHEIRQGGAAGAAQALVRARGRVAEEDEGSRRRHQRGGRPQAVPGRRSSRSGTNTAPRTRR